MQTLAKAMAAVELPRILLVDDLSTNLQVLVAGLKAHFRLLTATSARSALDLLAKLPELPKLIVLDVMMPDMDGIEMLSYLKSQARTADIPVILVTGHSSQQNELIGLSSGADDYLTKPVAPAVLIARAQNLIQRHDDRLKLRVAAHVFEHSGEAIIITDSDNKIVDVNAAFTRLTGYEKHEVLGCDPKLLASGRTSVDEYKAMWEAVLTHGFWQGEMWDRHKNGEVYPKLMTISTVRDEGDCISHFLASFIDISQHKKDVQRIHHLAHHDSLTGLPNRLQLLSFLEYATLVAKRMSEQLAVMFLDLDRFKHINDSLGHAAGDELLVQVAQRLNECVREYDMVFRLGGDEFVVVLRGKNLSAAAGAIAEKIRYQLAQPFQIRGSTLRTSTSIGLALYPQNSEFIGELMKQADTAMYVTKAEGGDGFHFFSNAMNNDAHEKLELENLLHEAMEKSHFELYYQPLLCLQSKRVVGAEVLLRWQHAERGFISPSKFVPLAEATNKIGKIGEWVLETACTQVMTWQHQGLHLDRIGVNVSARQFGQSQLIDLVGRVLGQTGMSANRLELELTETAVSSSLNDTVKVMRDLRGLGVKIALDDFGQGYSSLGQLKDLPLDRLKIDAAFVRDISSDTPKRRGAIAAAAISLGHTLGLEVIAEGVETLEHMEFLQDHGCDEVQGYYLAHPMPKEQFQAYCMAL